MPLCPRLKPNESRDKRDETYVTSGFQFASGLPFRSSPIRAKGDLPFRSPEYIRRAKEGQILILALFFMGIILFLSAALFTKLENYAGFSSGSIAKSQALNLAEAGIDYAIWQLNSGNTPSGTFDLGDSSQFQIATEEGSAPNQKVITSTGCIPSCTASKAKKINIQIMAEGTPYPFPVSDAAFIDNSIIFSCPGYFPGTCPGDAVINGDVFTNGLTEFYEDHGTINGNYETSLNLTAAQKSAVCTNVSPQPPWYCYDADNGVTYKPMISPNGWNAQTVRDAASPPQEGAEEFSSYSQVCLISRNTYYLGPAHILGDFQIRGCDLILRGPLWIGGNVFLENTNIKLDPAFFSDSGTVILTDGKIDVTHANVIIEKLTDPDRFILLWSTSTADNAIFFKIVPGAIPILGGFWYAPNGTISIQGNINVVAVAAENLMMRVNSDLTYEAGLGDATYSLGSVPANGWVLSRGTYQYLDD